MNCAFKSNSFFASVKQFTGLEDCQARDLKKLDFHFNASLSALNLAKLEAQRQHSGSEPFVFSMASVKRRAFNEHFLDRLISKLELEPTSIKSHPNYLDLCSCGNNAA